MSTLLKKQAELIVVLNNLPTALPENLIAASFFSSESSGGLAINGLVGCVWSGEPKEREHLSFVWMEKSLQFRTAVCTAKKDRFTSNKSGNCFMLGLGKRISGSCVVQEPKVCTKMAQRWQTSHFLILKNACVFFFFWLGGI